MSTLAEIEAAAATLSQEDRRRLLQHIVMMVAAGEDTPAPSLHDLMKDGCGIVDSGFSDLASRKDHLDGYGQ